MFRPSASSTYSSATSMMRTQALPNCCATSGVTSRKIPARMKTTSLFFSMMVLRGSGAIRHALAEQALRAQREHEDQHEEGEDVLVVAAEHAAGERADVAGAERLDQPEHHAAQHRARQVADAAEH